MDISESDSDDNNAPEELVDTTRYITVNLGLLPDKSRQKYERKYQLFSSWCISKNVTKISENILLAYFTEQSKVLKSSSLWSTYSMLKATIQVKHDINIGSFKKLLDFLKKQSVGYEPQKSKTLSLDEVETFIKTAPDDIYLMKKVVLIFGLAGACRRGELTKMSVNDVEDKGSMLIVKIPHSKSNKGRFFAVTDDGNEISYLEICRKYLKLRPISSSTDRLFLKYAKGVCVNQPVGINTIAKVPAEIATFLNLPNPDLYTGHCFRRTSATLLVEAGVNVMQSKHHRSLKSSTVTEGYVDSSISTNVSKNGPFIFEQLDSPETASVSNESNQLEDRSEVSSASGIVIRNCENCTFNISITNHK